MSKIGEFVEKHKVLTATTLLASIAVLGASLYYRIDQKNSFETPPPKQESVQTEVQLNPKEEGHIGSESSGITSEDKHNYQRLPKNSNISLDDFLPIYLSKHPELEKEETDLLSATVTNQELIAYYASIAKNLDFAFVASELYVEVGRGADFDTSVCSRALACGSAQVKEIAFLETVYSMLGVPGGFDRDGNTKVATLDKHRLTERSMQGDEAYVFAKENVFEDLDKKIIEELDEIIESEVNYSILEYQRKLDERIKRSTELENKFKEIAYGCNESKKDENGFCEGAFYQNEEMNKILEERTILKELQENDNDKLQRKLKRFWKKKIEGDLKIKESRDEEGKLVWEEYRLKNTKHEADWNHSLDLIGALNMRRVYANLDSGYLNINSSKLALAVKGYNAGPKYFANIKSNYEVIFPFLEAYSAYGSSSN